ncbi:DUF1289 domain-containing protein [Parathalassolituus penaei]|uniref:DUF1289 domain-containing protein n=1 Tax=Parathalassolituus penaei TaxID=2997323 RepID=A0A9X3EGK6_9GAMM|nr:DUF1289 domain-containing protein [Parathalassolituus penaei]MCY0967187.1 DUF1289 domain-containing protein [Parathalassolituus penaei]
MIDQGELFDIKSPCRGICTVNNRGYCKGCFRNREERFHWNEFSTYQKQLVVNLCEKRRLKVLATRQQSEAGVEDVTAIYQPAPQPDLFENQPAALTAAADTSMPAEPLPDPIPADKRHSPGANSQFGLFDE